MDANLTIEESWCKSDGKVRLTVRAGDVFLHHDEVHIHRLADRRRFVADLCRNRPGLDADEVTDQLTRLAAERGKLTDRDNNKSLADLLLKLAEDCEFFDDENRTAYVTLRVAEHWETWPVRSRDFRLWLRQRLWEEHKRTAYAEALQIAIETIETKAIFEGSQEDVFVRVAELDAAVWLDLSDSEWRTVCITAKGWELVTDRPSVKFIRPRGLLALPEPATDGDVGELRHFLNVSDTDFVLIVSWLLGCLRPRGPYPALCLFGEQGSGKSVACRLLRTVLDPNSAALRAAPKEPRDLVISANNSWIQSLDNISHIPAWLSDGLCRLATGAGFAIRELYSDRDETIFDSQRPVLINAIEEVVSRADLLDRALIVTLSTIPDEDRRAEAELWSAFEQARPRILGALLDAVSAGLRNLPHTKLDRLPRMADFTKWVTAGEPALCWPAGTFMAAYTQNRTSTNLAAIEACVVGPLAVTFMEKRLYWSGTYKDLLAELEVLADDVTKRRRGWPSSPRKLSGDLRRITPNLRAEGIKVTVTGRTRNGTTLVLEKVGETPSQPTPPSPLSGKSSSDNNLDTDQLGDEVGGEVADPESSTPTPSPHKSFNDKGCDEGDGSDGKIPPFSETPNALDETERELWTGDRK